MIPTKDVWLILGCNWTSAMIHPNVKKLCIFSTRGKKVSRSELCVKCLDFWAQNRRGCVEVLSLTHAWVSASAVTEMKIRKRMGFDGGGAAHVTLRVRCCPFKMINRVMLQVRLMSLLVCKNPCFKMMIKIHISHIYWFSEWCNNTFLTVTELCVHVKVINWITVALADSKS